MTDTVRTVATAIVCDYCDSARIVEVDVGKHEHPLSVLATLRRAIDRYAPLLVNWKRTHTESEHATAEAAR